MPVPPLILHLINPSREDQILDLRDSIYAEDIPFDYKIDPLTRPIHDDDMGLGIVTSSALLTVKSAAAAIGKLLAAIAAYVKINKQKIIIEIEGRKVEIESTDPEKSMKVVLEILEKMKSI